MRALLTSSGIANPAMQEALVDLLGKPVGEANALVIPTAIYPFQGGGQHAGRLIRGEVNTPLTDLGWASVGVLELSVLPSIERDVWVGDVEAADALLFWGGDPIFLAYWLEESGLAAVLPSLSETVYVGVSAGAMAAGAMIAESYTEARSGRGNVLSESSVRFDSADGDVTRIVMTAKGVGLVDFAVIPHLENPKHPDASLANGQRWADHVAVPTYAIGEQAALAVRDGAVEVVGDGTWRLYNG